MPSSRRAPKEGALISGGLGSASARVAGTTDPMIVRSASQCSRRTSSGAKRSSTRNAWRSSAPVIVR
jgi:hypothetical protein